MEKLMKYLYYEFESSCERTKEYIDFERTYKSYLKSHLPNNYTIHKFNPNHFCFSCIIKSDTDKFLYLSIDDVRFSPQGWYNNILIREMANENDYHGKSNYYTRLENIANDLKELNEKGYTTSYWKNRDYEM